MTTKQATMTVDRYYGVVPRPRSFDDPAAWPRRNALGGKGKWRAYYGYAYRPESAVSQHGEARDKFPGSAVAAAMVAHGEIGGKIVLQAQVEKLAEEVEARRAGKAAPVAHNVTAAERFAASEAVILCKPEPVVEAVPEPVEAVVPAAIAEPLVARDLRYSAVAEVLREMALGYGPRRAHKLVAMADFVEAHGKRAAA